MLHVMCTCQVTLYTSWHQSHSPMPAIKLQFMSWPLGKNACWMARHKARGLNNMMNGTNRTVLCVGELQELQAQLSNEWRR